MTDLPATAFVLFGATGDLSRRMVLPAFFDLAGQGLLPADWRLIGSGRGERSDEEFTDLARAALEEFGPLGDGDGDAERLWADFAGRLRFAGGGFSAEDPGTLRDVLEGVRGDLGGDVQLVHYLAVPPEAFDDITRGLQRHGLAEGARVVYEKPYGTSPETFRELDDLVLSVLDEEQVFRIDHFLGKEGTQDLHVLRFANGMFEHLWSREHVAQVQIDVPEELDVAQRAAFYDATGAGLDMLVTHLFQLAAEVAMEPPASFAPDDLRRAREAVLSCFRPLDTGEVVLGQFDGYTGIDGVADDSRTDTYVAARLWVDTDRWRDVPFVLRTGKRMAASEQRVSLLMRVPEGPVTDPPGHGNVLSLSLSGSGAVDLALVAKQPGPDLALARATATLELADVPGGTPLPPYASLLHDVLVGDRSLFTSGDGLAQAWRAFAPLQEDPPAVHGYAPGSWGPAEAEALAEPCGWLLGDGRG
ncbi:glucose-6-phosphate dehydrogenase [Geodermatophilus marinus]|uniref:glucose-6-phosphate dehydrogenase n=1 Tax=Geodermatophilus sp. LHW52908 TaxID=2303986 RepID=UPI000E3E2767|nr:glucose-6-phosphate dehydrogenase (NADP(+)) [Geodermatophilus sp. LHW52908]RFU19447.1 glucose-6-phosphate dehydrogenase (NADP(+)) [Geodermatophilus sp. LHW52908]